jgi:NTP pyrophosphatase (non-canonical NTP hydrolase)
MQLAEYQSRTSQTAIYPPGSRLVYPVLGLVGEAGELAGKVKKVIRDDNGVIDEEKRLAMIDELGDVLWYVAAVARDLNVCLSLVAARNLQKLEDRKNRGVLQGSGDNR